MAIEMFLAQNDLGQFLIPIVVAIVYAVAHLMKQAKENRPAPKRPAAPPPRPMARDERPNVQIDRDPVMQPNAPARGRGGQEDLDRLLDELGLRRPTPEGRPEPGQARSRRGEETRRPAKPARPTPRRPNRHRPEVDREVSAPAAQRELHSSLEGRHGGSVQSRLASQHLASSVERRPMDTQSAAQPTSSSSQSTGDTELRSILADPSTLRRAYALSIILGPPLSLREPGPQP
jgi:hypothetical protein